MYEALMLVILAGIIGALMGSFTGIVPGIHANTLALMLLSAAIAVEGTLDVYVSEYIDTRVLLAVIIGATSLAHTFANFIPGTFLGAPEGETALSVLPMHDMVRKGNGYRAISLSAIGSFGAVIFCIIMVFPIRLIIGEPLPDDYSIQIASLNFTIPSYLQLDGYNYMNGNSEQILEYFNSKIKRMLLLLAAVSTLLIVTEKKQSKVRTAEGETIRIDNRWSRQFGILQAFLVFITSGVFGYIVLDDWEGYTQSPFGIPSTALFPAFTGLFGVATLLFTINNAPALKRQDTVKNDYCNSEFHDIQTICRNLDIAIEEVPRNVNNNLKLEVGCGSWINKKSNALCYNCHEKIFYEIGKTIRCPNCNNMGLEARFRMLTEHN